MGTAVKQIYPAYQAKLAASNAADFDDLLLHVAGLLGENPEIRQTLDERYRFILVDEYQDTNLAQYAIARPCRSTIPTWRSPATRTSRSTAGAGANLNNILEFEEDFPEVHIVRLERTIAARSAISASPPP